MSILLTIVLVILAAVAAVLLYANTRPPTFRVERSITIKAPAAAIFGHINDFHKWPAWSPWENIDPTMTRTYEGADSGVGAVYRWDGNKKVGSGRMEVLDQVQPGKVHILLDFYRPFKAQNQIDITLADNGTTTTVNWAMYGPNLLISKIMGLFMNFDQMIGKDFEKGLSQLKAVAER